MEPKKSSVSMQSTIIISRKGGEAIKEAEKVRYMLHALMLQKQCANRLYEKQLGRKLSTRRKFELLTKHLQLFNTGYNFRHHQ